MLVRRLRMIVCQLTSGALVVGLVLVAGCGSHGPALPGPGDTDRQITGTVVENDFTVPAGQRVACLGDVVVQCETATIEGELLAQPATGSGQNGSSITIQSQGDVTLEGRIVAGAATDGAAETGGGDGGAVTVESTDGDITVGGDAVTADGAAAAGGTVLQSGNGGHGGDGTLGGAGGHGGDILLDCPNGTLTINPGADMFVIGNGGSGGQAAYAGESLQGVGLPEQMPNLGGDSGRLLLRASDYVGVEPQEFTHPIDNQVVKAAVVEGIAASGGHGGDAGDVSMTLVSAAKSSGRTDRVAAEPNLPDDPNTVAGADGGNGAISGGDGADATFNRSGQQAPWGGQWDNEPSTSAVGGEGGGASTGSWSGTLVMAFYPGDLYGGDGGNATARARQGGNGGACEAGDGGGGADASGGPGGKVFCPLAASDTLHPGAGGDAVAIAGHGGDAGDCCEPDPGDGQPGGEGGSAEAFGGPGGHAFGGPTDPTSSGPGGDASAASGRGGNGGDGVPRGDAGWGGTVKADPGWGTPNGRKLVKTKGANGARGDHCTPPPPKPRTYTLFAQKSPSRAISVYQQWLSYITTAGSTNLGGANFQVELFEGQSIAVTPSGGRLFACTRDGEIWAYNDPATGGDRPPDAKVAIPNPNNEFERPQVWLDDQRDILYCSMDVFIYAYHGASSMQSGAAPTRTIQVPQNTSSRIPMAGDPDNDRLFAAFGNTVHVFDDVSGLSGLRAGDRVIQPSNRQLLGIAYDSQRDLAYVCQNDNYPGGVSVIADASSADGAITPVRVLAGNNTGFVTNEMMGCAVFPDDDLLFVAQGGFLAETRVMVWENASTADGNLAPLQSGGLAHAFGLWREP